MEAEEARKAGLKYWEWLDDQATQQIEAYEALKIKSQEDLVGSN